MFSSVRRKKRPRYFGLIIQQSIPLAMEIHSDKWGAYRGLSGRV